MYKIGIMGAGLVSYSHANAIKEVENAKLVAVSDIVETRAKKFAKEYGCDYYLDSEEMLKNADIDIVIICLPSHIHEEYVNLAAKYKKNILCEKPVERTAAATERILEVVKNSGKIFMVGQVLRFWTGYSEIKEMYDAGGFGEIHMVFASRRSALPNWTDGWIIDPSRGLGAIQDMHIHDIDFLFYLFGPADYVFCHASKDDTGCWNHVMTSIAYKSGQKAVAEASFNMVSSYPFTMYFKIAGTKADLEFSYKAGFNIGDRDQFNSKVSLFYEDRESVHKVAENYDAFVRQLKYYLSCLDKGMQPSLIPHLENLEVIKTMEAIRLSADTNQIVKL